MSLQLKGFLSNLSKSLKYKIIYKRERKKKEPCKSYNGKLFFGIEVICLMK